MKFGFGQSIKRLEDDRLITGKGRYTDDIYTDNQCYAYFLRSPVAHADIASIDTSEAEAAPGVLAVITGKAAQDAGLGEAPAALTAKNRDGSTNYSTKRPIIATDRVRFVGDIVALVIAESVNQAKDAAEQIVVDYDDLPVIVDMEQAVTPDAPVVWADNVMDGRPSNILVDWELGDKQATDDAFAKAAHVTSVRLINNRVVANSMEPRTAVGHYDAATDRYTLDVASQGVHGIRGMIANFGLGVDPEKVRVRTGDVGGGFGMKIFNYPEYVAVLFAAKQVGRTVKWACERTEAFLSDTQGRDHITNAEIAFDADGKALAVRVKTLAGLGAYLSQFAPFIVTTAAPAMQIGVYDIPAVYQNVWGVATNTTPVDAYRGAGRPEAAFVIERLMEKAAHELNIAPNDLRRKNFVRPDQMPYAAANGLVFDSGHFEETMDMAVKAADWDGFAARKTAAEASGKLLGRGMGYYVEKAATLGSEISRITVRPDGHVLINVGTQSNGQGHATAFAQLVSSMLEIPVETVELQFGDTDALPSGGGTGGSRSLGMGSITLKASAEALIEKGKAIAAKALETDPGTIVYEDAAFKQQGTNEFITLTDVAKLAADESDDEGLVAMETAVNKNGMSYPNGCHICEAEIDPETGSVRITRYTCVDDFGRVLNPLLVEGQVQGGVAQGLGQALGELAVYDTESGQLQNGSYMDYYMPRASDIPDINFSYNEVPAQVNEFGVKGCGEAGTIGAMPCSVNAVIDALRPYGVTDIDMPITPLKVWNIVSAAQKSVA